MTTMTMGDLIADLCETFEHANHDPELALVATEVKLTELAITVAARRRKVLATAMSSARPARRRLSGRPASSRFVARAPLAAAGGM